VVGNEGGQVDIGAQGKEFLIIKTVGKGVKDRPEEGRPNGVLKKERGSSTRKKRKKPSWSAKQTGARTTGEGKRDNLRPCCYQKRRGEERREGGVTVWLVRRKGSRVKRRGGDSRVDLKE